MVYTIDDMLNGKKTSLDKHLENVIVSDSVKSYGNDPYFIEKNERAKKRLAKMVLPKI